MNVEATRSGELGIGQGVDEASIDRIAHESHAKNVPADKALELLKAGNERYVSSGAFTGDVSAQIRQHTSQHGQAPYAIVLACSDSRVVPEIVFDEGIGRLFVIRVAGNVVDNHQLGSMEYAEEHLGCNLIVVLGHTGCGAVEAAIKHDPEGSIKHITDDIREAIGSETDEEVACRLNVEHTVARIERDRRIARDEDGTGMRVMGAIYHTGSGLVEFL